MCFFIFQNLCFVHYFYTFLLLILFKKNHCFFYHCSTVCSSYFLTLLTCYFVVFFIPYICKNENETTHNQIHFAFNSFLFRVGKQGQHQNMRISDGSRNSSRSKSRNREKTVHSLLLLPYLIKRTEKQPYMYSNGTAIRVEK